MADFSVLMSVYAREKPEFLDACFQSLLRQTEPATEWVIVEDGPLTEELTAVLDRYVCDYPGLIKRVPLAENVGLGAALAVGLPSCSFELVARMDTDDLAVADRFAKQLAAFRADPTLELCGGQIDEFIDSPDNPVSRRCVPLTQEEIRNYQKRRDAFNHMTVMFKKSAVLRAGNYQPCPLMEDSYLWARMLQSGVHCRNLSDTLVSVRVGTDLYARRGGWRYFQKYREGRRRILETGLISRWDYTYTLAVQLAVALMPASLRTWVFQKLLHPQR